jgi:hypothetical protein
LPSLSNNKKAKMTELNLASRSFTTIGSSVQFTLQLKGKGLATREPHVSALLFYPGLACSPGAGTS